MLPSRSENPSSTPIGLSPYNPSSIIGSISDGPLRAAWDTISPQLCKVMDTRKIRVSHIMPVRFSTLGADGKEILGPDTIMIGVWPGTTTVKEGQDASEEILALPKENGVEGVEVKFREQAIKRL